MDIRILRTQKECDLYDHWVKHHPDGTLWQSLERTKYLEALGKEVRVYAAFENENIVSSALVVIDKTSFGLSTWEIPRGPLENSKLLETIIKDAKHDRCMALYFSPTQQLTMSNTRLILSPRHIHCEATRIINLTQSDDEILKQMKPKGRYNIRVAEKNAVTIEQSQDIDAFFALVKSTSNRDGFISLSKRNYETFLRDIEGSFLLLAYCSQNSEEKTKKPIAGLLGVCWNKMGTYYYGASDYASRAVMAPYLLQWGAIRHCKAAGCTQYDLLGVAPPDAPPTHPWQGITRFKEQFGGELVSYPAEQQVVLKPLVYNLLNLKRRFF